MSETTDPGADADGTQPNPVPLAALRCDEPGCTLEGIWRWPTEDDGYRWTCHKHSVELGALW